jgi:hypothetical protein
MTSNGATNGEATAHVAELLKIDILAATHELDNEKQMKEISRSFICT